MERDNCQFLQETSYKNPLGIYFTLHLPDALVLKKTKAMKASALSFVKSAKDLTCF